MKKFSYKLPILLSAVALLLCSAFSFPVGASAVSLPILTQGLVLSAPEYYTISGDISGDGSYTGSLFIYGTADSEGNPLPVSPGNYVVYGSPYVVSDTFIAAAQVLLTDNSNGSVSAFDFGDSFVVPSSGSYSLVVQSFTEPVIEIVTDPEPLYFSAFQMFADFIYGEGAVLTAEQNMTLTILATLASLFVVLFPFLIVFLVVRFVIWLR